MSAKFNLHQRMLGCNHKILYRRLRDIAYTKKKKITPTILNMKTVPPPEQNLFATYFSEGATTFTISSTSQQKAKYVYF